jgi:hypothetical protein
MGSDILLARGVVLRYFTGMGGYELRLGGYELKCFAGLGVNEFRCFAGLGMNEFRCFVGQECSAGL